MVTGLNSHFCYNNRCKFALEDTQSHTSQSAALAVSYSTAAITFHFTDFGGQFLALTSNLNADVFLICCSRSLPFPEPPHFSLHLICLHCFSMRVGRRLRPLNICLGACLRVIFPCVAFPHSCGRTGGWRTWRVILEMDPRWTWGCRRNAFWDTWREAALIKWVEKIHPGIWASIGQMGTSAVSDGVSLIRMHIDKGPWSVSNNLTIPSVYILAL